MWIQLYWRAGKKQRKESSDDVEIDIQITREENATNENNKDVIEMD